METQKRKNNFVSYIKQARQSAWGGNLLLAQSCYWLFLWILKKHLINFHQREKPSEINPGTETDFPARLLPSLHHNWRHFTNGCCSYWLLLCKKQFAAGCWTLRTFKGWKCASSLHHKPKSLIHRIPTVTPLIQWYPVGKGRAEWEKAPNISYKDPEVKKFTRKPSRVSANCSDAGQSCYVNTAADLSPSLGPLPV